MSHGERASRLEKYMRRQFEYWSRRPYFGEGKVGKRMTHRAERRAGKRASEEES